MINATDDFKDLQNADYSADYRQYFKYRPI